MEKAESLAKCADFEGNDNKPAHEGLGNEKCDRSPSPVMSSEREKERDAILSLVPLSQSASSKERLISANRLRDNKMLCSRKRMERGLSNRRLRGGFHTSPWLYSSDEEFALNRRWPSSESVIVTPSDQKPNKPAKQ